MKIVPGIGLDGFSFGITEVDLISKLGTPDKIYTTDEGCRRLQFYNLKLELSFEPENDNRLGWIEVHNPKLEFDGNELFGLSEKDVIPIVSKLLNEEPKFEDFGSFLSVFYDENWVELQFQFGVLDCVSFGVLYGETGVPEWPSS